MNHRFLKFTPFIAAISLLAAHASASSRRFCYSFETTTMPAGAMELETTVTRATGQADDSASEHYDIRHEFEYGLTDRLQVALYFARWHAEKSSAKGWETEFKGVAAEAIYNLTDPNTTAFGSAVYGEVKGGENFFELEAKLLFQKNRGAWSVVYNVGGGVEWEDDDKNPQAELMQSAGGLYQISASWSVGAEIRHEVAMPNADSLGEHGLYLGPNLAWRHQRLGLTVAGLWQTTDLAAEPDFQLRTILSLDF